MLQIDLKRVGSYQDNHLGQLDVSHSKMSQVPSSQTLEIQPEANEENRSFSGQAEVSPNSRDALVLQQAVPK